LLVVGAVGVFVGRMIQAAVSREREFLADASAVQFTRNPDGIAGALKKIAGWSEGGKIKDPHAGEMGHFFLANPLKASFTGAFSTHPPLEDRIRAIDPSFRAPSRKGRGGRKFTAGAAGFAGASTQLDAKSTAGIVGNFDHRHLSMATGLLNRFSDQLKDACHHPHLAREVVFAVFWHESHKVQEKQKLALEEDVPSAQIRNVLNHANEIRALGPETRLTLIELCLPTLKQLEADERRRLTDQAMRLIRADDQLHLFEFALIKILVSALGTDDSDRSSLPNNWDAAHILFSALAHSGNDSAEDARLAFESAFLQLSSQSRPLLAPTNCSPGQLNRALESLKTLAPKQKQRILELAIECVKFNGRLTALEKELVRAVSESLEIPLSMLTVNESEAA